MSKKEINDILDKVDDIALTTFVQAIQPDDEQGTPRTSKNQKGKKLLVEEVKEYLPKYKYAKIKAVLMVIGPKLLLENTFLWRMMKPHFYNELAWLNNTWCKMAFYCVISVLNK
jgi:hypothetical protein